MSRHLKQNRVRIKILKIMPFPQSRCVAMTSIDAEISEDKTGKINSCCRCKIVISPKIIIWYHLNVTMCATESVTLRKEDLRPADPPFAAIGAGCTFATSRICGKRWRQPSAPFNWPSEPKERIQFFCEIWFHLIVHRPWAKSHYVDLVGSQLLGVNIIPV